MNALYRIFWYLEYEMSRGKNHNVGSMVYDDRQTEVDDSLFPQSAQDKGNYFYPDDKQLITSKTPKPRGCSVKTRTYVDADHAVNLEMLEV